jgi:uncharacterized protein (UPF0335 family)
MTIDIDGLIRRLRDVAMSYHPVCDEAADALRSQAERIQALEADKASLHAEIRDWYKATKEWAERSEALEAKCAELQRLEGRWKYMEDRFIGADFEWGHAEDGQGGVPVLLIQIDEDLKVWGDLALTVDAAIGAQSGSKEAS